MLSLQLVRLYGKHLAHQARTQQCCACAVGRPETAPCKGSLPPTAALPLRPFCPLPAADVNSVRFIRNTPGLKPLVDDKVGWAGSSAVHYSCPQPA